jgi:transposase
MYAEQFKKQLLQVYKTLLLCEIQKHKRTKGFSCGRKRTINYEYYLDWIIFVLVSGISWEDLQHIPVQFKCKPRSIKQQFYRWRDQGIFKNVHSDLLRFYVENNKQINITYIDSTDIQNRNCLKENTDFNTKFRNKRAIRLHSLCDKNKVTHSFVITGANIKDEQMIEKVIEKIEIPLKQTYRNPLYVVGDKGYIYDLARKKLKAKNIILVYPYRKNQKKRHRKKKKELLKKRTTVEYSYNQLKRGHKRVNQIYDRKMDTYMTFLKMANSCQIIKSPHFCEKYREYSIRNYK